MTRGAGDADQFPEPRIPARSRLDRPLSAVPPLSQRGSGSRRSAVVADGGASTRRGAGDGSQFAGGGAGGTGDRLDGPRTGPPSLCEEARNDIAVVEVADRGTGPLVRARNGQ